MLLKAQVQVQVGAPYVGLYESTGRWSACCTCRTYDFWIRKYLQDVMGIVHIVTTTHSPQYGNSVLILPYPFQMGQLVDVRVWEWEGTLPHSLIQDQFPWIPIKKVGSLAQFVGSGQLERGWMSGDPFTEYSHLQPPPPSLALANNFLR